MSTRPKSQIVNIKPVTREFRGPLTPITLVPHEDNFKPKWLESWIADGGQEYALRDLRTKEGRCGVAKFNGWLDEWVAKEEAYGENTPTSRKQYDCLFQVAGTQTKNCVYFGSKEGLHRGMALTHVVTDSGIDPFTAQLKQGSLMKEKFFENGLKSQVESPTNAIPAALSVSLSAKGGNIMMDTAVQVLVTYMTKVDADAKNVLAACRRQSQGISDSKLNSAKPSPTFLIGVFGEEFMKTLTLNALTQSPDTSSIKTPIQPRMSVKQAEALFKTAEGNTAPTLPVSPILDDTRVQEYINNPLDLDKRKEAMDALKCDVLDSIPITTPFYIDFNRMAVQSGPLDHKMYWLTGEMRNEIILLPVIMLHLYAGWKNLTPREAVGRDELIRLTQYALRYHFGAETGQSNMHQLHGALTACYNLSWGLGYPNTEFRALIGASVLIVNMWNACLAAASYEPNLAPKDRLEKVYEAAELFGGAFVTLDSAAASPTIESSIYHLGELFCYEINFYIL